MPLIDGKQIKAASVPASALVFVPVVVQITSATDELGQRIAYSPDGLTQYVGGDLDLYPTGGF
jgi:hypothetical protein